MPPPGGDFIGRRRLDAHLDAFVDLGARVEGDRWIELTSPNGGLRACAIFMDEPSVMGTENALMAAALTPGPTTISNAACEPHVQDLARLLTKMGATVDGIGSNVMTVHGRDRLGGAEHTISADHIEVGSFMALAAATGGELRVRGAEPARPDHGPASVPSPRARIDARRRRRHRARRAATADQVRRRRRDPEGRGRPLAGLPGRPDLDRAGPRHPGGRRDPDLREDVREPPLLRRQAGRDGRSDHAVRSPQGDRQRSEPASRRTRREPRHPRRDGDAHRRARRGRRLGDRQHPPDRPRLRADRRAPPLARRPDRARLGRGRG